VFISVFAQRTCGYNCPFFPDKTFLSGHFVPVSRPVISAKCLVFSVLSLLAMKLQLLVAYHQTSGGQASMKVNCGEFKGCGRQPGGVRAKELGVCPVTTHSELTGVHGGANAGRACWVVAGSLCGGKIQGHYAQKLNNCWRCDFLNRVKQEEDPTAEGFSVTRLGMERSLQKKTPPASMGQDRH
jgi:hypothetical protein